MAHILALVFGILGNIASIVTFGAPVATSIKIIKGKSVFEYRSLPYVTSLLSQSIWLYYGCLLQRYGVFIIVVSIFGCISQATYIAIYLRFATIQHRRHTVKLVAIMDVGIFLVILLFTLFVVRSVPIRHMIVGLSCIAISVANYVAPLGVVWQVIQTQNVQYMPFALSLGLTATATLWFVYGFAMGDLFIMIPNLLGIVLGAIQILIYGYVRYIFPLFQHILFLGDFFSL